MSSPESFRRLGKAGTRRQNYILLRVLILHVDETRGSGMKGGKEREKGGPPRDRK